MAIEDIQGAKAPGGWSPSPDQRAKIAADARLQRMGRDDLYFYFNQKPRPAAPRAPAPASRGPQAPSGGLLGSVLGRVTSAMRGK